MRLSSLPQAMKFVWRAKKVWSRPKRARILIFDRNGSEVFLPYIDFSQAEIFDTRAERINIPVLLTTLLRDGVKSSLARYAKHYLDCVRPAVVLTHIDNNLTFYLLKDFREGVKTVSIQNGARDDTLFDTMQAARRAFGWSFKADHILCFGRHVGRKYAEQIEARIEPIGSFMNNHIPRTALVAAGKSVLFLSQYRPPHTDWTEPVMPVGERVVPLSEFYSAERFLLPRLQEYCRTHGFELKVCGCSLDEPDRERDFFVPLLGGSDWEFLPRRDLASSYRRVDSARCVVFIDSTLGYEALGRGAKAAAFSLRGRLATKTDDRDFGLHAKYPPTGPFWTNLADDLEVPRVMAFITSVSDEEWYTMRQLYVADLVAYDPGNTRFVQLMRQYNVPLKPEHNNVQQ